MKVKKFLIKICVLIPMLIYFGCTTAKADVLSLEEKARLVIKIMMDRNKPYEIIVTTEGNVSASRKINGSDACNGIYVTLVYSVSNNNIIDFIAFDHCKGAKTYVAFDSKMGEWVQSDFAKEKYRYVIETLYEALAPRA